MAQQETVDEQIIRSIYEQAQTCIQALPETAMPYEVQACYDEALTNVLSSASPEDKARYQDKTARKQLLIKSMLYGDKLDKNQGS
ncbi:MAG: hypothetical protein ACFCUI_04365 [Bernardetiaceae bacterium]